MRTIRTLKIAAAATIAAAAVTATLALPAHASFSGVGFGTDTTLAAAKVDALQDLRGNFSDCSGPIIYSHELFDGTYYSITVTQSPCLRAN